MAFEVKPKVYLVAQSYVDHDEMSKCLEELDPDLNDWVYHRKDLSDAELLSEFAGKSCYMSFSTTLNRNLTRVNTRENKDYLQDAIIGNNHGSVLEHSSVSFYIKNVSRVFTHELIRHRVGTAYSQLSGRYVRLDDIPYYFPENLQNSDKAKEASKIFKQQFEAQEAAYKKLCELYDIDNKGFEEKKKLTSSFRRIVGDGMCYNNILFTCNHRELRHVIELRTSRGAEEEIRYVFYEIFGLMIEKHNNIYCDAQFNYVENSDIPEIIFK